MQLISSETKLLLKYGFILFISICTLSAITVYLILFTKFFFPLKAILSICITALELGIAIFLYEAYTSHIRPWR